MTKEEEDNYELKLTRSTIKLPDGTWRAQLHMDFLPQDEHAAQVMSGVMIRAVDEYLENNGCSKIGGSADGTVH